MWNAEFLCEPARCLLVSIDNRLNRAIGKLLQYLRMDLSYIPGANDTDAAALAGRPMYPILAHAAPRSAQD